MHRRSGRPTAPRLPLLAQLVQAMARVPSCPGPRPAAAEAAVLPVEQPMAVPMAVPRELEQRWAQPSREAKAVVAQRYPKQRTAATLQHPLTLAAVPPRAGTSQAARVQTPSHQFPLCAPGRRKHDHALVQVATHLRGVRPTRRALPLAPNGQSARQPLTQPPGARPRMPQPARPWATGSTRRSRGHQPRAARAWQAAARPSQ
mmetsp:Transcript_52301/g.162004  ORF Transcript_52301/g.162004 Transcript_52301/m.162004 type:complete len:203 (-) Transcript_52301:83-691(-)